MSELAEWLERVASEELDGESGNIAALLKGLVQEFPDSDRYAGVLASSYSVLGMVAYDRGENEACLDYHTRALKLREAMDRRAGHTVLSLKAKLKVR